MSHEGGGGGGLGSRIFGFFIILIALMLAASFFSSNIKTPTLTPGNSSTSSASSVPTVTPPQNAPAPGTSATPAGTSPATRLPTINFPRRGGTITSPVTVSGDAPGTWFFEGSFPVVVVDWDGKVIGNGHVTAQENWMTTNYVPFSGVIEFTVDPSAPYHTGSVIFQKDNPSGLPQNDAALEVPVSFQ
jgi:hypothetical protein